MYAGKNNQITDRYRNLFIRHFKRYTSKDDFIFEIKYKKVYLFFLRKKIINQEYKFIKKKYKKIEQPSTNLETNLDNFDEPSTMKN